jgi:hypothetical protein
VKDLKKKVDDPRGSRFKRYILAMDYKRLSKKTFRVVEVNPHNNRSVSRVSTSSQRASNRAVDDNLMNQVDEAMQDTGRLARLFLELGGS